MSIGFSADDCSKGEYVKDWRSLVSNRSMSAEFHRVGGEDNVWVWLRSIASIKVFEIRSSSFVLSITPLVMRQHDPEYGKAELVLEGKMVVSQDGRQAVLGAGDLTIHDATRPIELIGTEDVRLVGVMFPLRMISMPRNGLRDLTATRIDGRSGSGALLASLLTVLSSKLLCIRPQEEVGISSAVGGLLTAILAQLAGNGPEMGAEGRRSVLVTRIRYFVEAEIAHSDLTPASIAATHHISVRQLHRLFEREEMTVTELIRTRRLEGCRHDLADPLLRDRSISAVAARWGIPDSAKFSRMFRAAYGVSPREYRTVLLGRNGTQPAEPEIEGRNGYRRLWHGDSEGTSRNASVLKGYGPG